MVITADEKLPEFAVLAQVLAGAQKLDRDTAAGTARHCWGVLGRDLDEAAALDLERRCADFGVKTLRLPCPPPALAPAELMKKASFDKSSAAFAGAAGAVSAVHAEISVLAAAPIKTENVRTIKTTEGPSAQEKAVRLGIMTVTGLPIGLGKSREVNKEVKSSEMSFYLDILLAGPPRRLRVASDDFDFSCLKENKTYSSQVNFRLFCLAMAAFAPAAARNSGLLAMLGSRPLSALPYDSLEDLEKEELRLLLAARGK